MLKLKSGESLFGLIKRNRRLVLVIAILVLGVFLVILGSVGMGGKREAEADDEEARLSSLLSEIDGVGECKVMISLNSRGEVASAVVVCRGASDVEVRRALLEAVTSLYGIGSNRVSIAKMKNK